jgi:hypothetical protein
MLFYFCLFDFGSGSVFANTSIDFCQSTRLWGGAKMKKEQWKYALGSARTGQLSACAFIYSIIPWN